MNNVKLTAKETAVMQAIADGAIDFFRDFGLVAGANGWSDVFTDTLAGWDKYNVSKTARGVASVANSLAKKGFLISDNNDEDGASFTLTEAGAAFARELHGDEEAAEAAEAEGVELEVVETAAPVEEFTAGIEEWTTEGANLTEIQWTEWRFTDGSRALRRRKQVSGAWRTDFWGSEFFGDKERATSSAKVKAAIAKGNFTR